MCYNIAMKAFISLILVFSLVLPIHAATLTPSLSTQMVRQEAVNKRNSFAEKRQAAQSRKIAIEQRRASIQAQREQSKTTSQSMSSAPTIVSQPIPTVTPPRVASSTVTPVSGVDMSRVRSTWLGWYNTTRATR